MRSPADSGAPVALAWPRAVVAAFATVALALAAHVLGRGMVARPLPVLAAGVGVVLLARSATRRELGAAQLLGAEIAAQAGLHLLLCLPFDVSTTGRPSMGAGAMSPGATSSGAMGSGAMGHADWRMGLPWHESARMLGAHLLAAVLMALLLRQSERALAGLLGLLLMLAGAVARWRALLAPASPLRPAGPALTAVATPRVATQLLMLRAALARRGPPARALAA